MSGTKHTAPAPKKSEPDAPTREESSSKPQTEGSTAEATTTTATSGATVEQAVVDALPMKHPAIDSEPRKGLPPESSQIDFNDPNH
tara:strand:- start:34550 stop:34807 length:258 start_codon:yes stop_codon:yes gene_type:complete